MDKLINNIIAQDLTGTDVNYLTRGKATVFIYKNLLQCNSILDAFGSNNALILLFPVQSDMEGHFISILKNDKTKTITHWDPYGLSWIQERAYTDNQYVQRHLLGNLYTKAQQNGWTVNWNKYRLQQMKKNISTCGRWSCSRIRLSYLSDSEFASLFLNQKESSDWLVTIMTFVALNEDETMEESVVRSLTNLKSK